MYETIYCVQILDYRLPNLDEVISTFITTDYESAKSEFSKMLARLRICLYLCIAIQRNSTGKIDILKQYTEGAKVVR